MKIYLLFSFLTLAGLMACSEQQPVPLVINTDNCDFCKMTISDPKFGAELLTNKGKIYKFDAIECLAGFCAEQTVKPEDVHSRWAINLIRPGELIDVATSTFFQCERLPSPMGKNYSAVPTQTDFDRVAVNYQCRKMTWDEILRAEQ